MISTYRTSNAGDANLPSNSREEFLHVLWDSVHQEPIQQEIEMLGAQTQLFLWDIWTNHIAKHTPGIHKQDVTRETATVRLCIKVSNVIIGYPEICVSQLVMQGNMAGNMSETVDAHIARFFHFVAIEKSLGFIYKPGWLSDRLIKCDILDLPWNKHKLSSDHESIKV